MQGYIKLQVAYGSELLGFQHFPTHHIPAQTWPRLLDRRLPCLRWRKERWWLQEIQPLVCAMADCFFECFGSASANYWINCLFALRDVRGRSPLRVVNCVNIFNQINHNGGLIFITLFGKKVGGWLKGAFRHNNSWRLVITPLLPTAQTGCTDC